MRDNGPATNAIQLSLVATMNRHDPMYPFFVELNQKLSMLHPDVLGLLFHYASTTAAPILEIGPYIGGSTIALATPRKAVERAAFVVSVELGESFRHDTYRTESMVDSLRANLQQYGVSEMVKLIVGSSRSPEVVSQVEHFASAAPFGMLVIDADGKVREDIDSYRRMLAPRAFLVVDDYYSPGAPDKEDSTRRDLDALCAAGEIECFGVHGWGTWFGRFLK
jgi:predicted O-methyltransferase YrrM